MLNPPDGTDADGVLPVATKLFAVSSNNINDINTMHTANHHQQPKKRNKKDTKNTNKLFDRENVRIGIIGSGLAGLSAALAILRAARYRSSATASIATNACADKHTNSFNDNNNDSKGNNHGCMTERKGRETPNMNISIQIIIYERDTQISDRKEGYGMTITYNPDGPLAKLELLEEVAQKDCPSRSHYLLDGQGNVTGYFGNAFYAEDNILIATTTDNDNGDAITESNESLSVKPLTTNTDEKSAATTTTTEIQVARGAGQRGNIRIPRSELRSILFNALMKEAGEIAAMNAAQSTDYHPLTATKSTNEGNDGECNKGDTNSTICNSGSNCKAGCADASGVDNGVNNNQEVCTIQWNKRLESYIDRPMESKLNSIFGNDSSNASKQMHGSQQNQQPNRSVLLNFYDGTTDQVDLLIGADGVNSVVAHQYLSRVLPACSNKKKEKEGQPLKATTNEERKSANSPVDDTTTNNATTSPSSPTSTGMSSAATPHYLGIFIILGITNTFHPLIDERGFYTLDGTHRLFIMPFEGSRIEDARIAAAAKAVAAAHCENKTDGESDGINTAIASSKNVENHPPKRRRTMWQLSFPVLDRKEAQRMSILPPKELQKEVMRRCGQWHEPFPQMVTETPLNTIWGT